jgi:hypothetical protein
MNSADYVKKCFVPAKTPQDKGLTLTIEVHRL